VVRVNEALLDGVLLGDERQRDATISNVTERLVEFKVGSTAYVVGLFLGDAMRRFAVRLEAPPAAQLLEAAWGDAGTELGAFVRAMVDKAESGLLAACEPFLDFLGARQVGGFLREVVRLANGRAAQPQLSEEQEWRALAALCNHDDHDRPLELRQLRVEVCTRVLDALLCLLDLGDPDLGLPLGHAYAQIFGRFQASVNGDISRQKRSAAHGIDGERALLFDCKFVPGFGLQVAGGLTVWAGAKNYLWMSACALEFLKCLTQLEDSPRGFVVHLECTELFPFAPFFHELGVPCIDGVNLCMMATRCSTEHDAMHFVTFRQPAHRVPAAVVARTEGVCFHRSPIYKLRTPACLAEAFYQQEELYTPLLLEQSRMWAQQSRARVCYGGSEMRFEPAFDAGPLTKHETLYVESSSLACTRARGKRWYLPPKEEQAEAAKKMAPAAPKSAVAVQYAA